MKVQFTILALATVCIIALSGPRSHALVTNILDVNPFDSSLWGPNVPVQVWVDLPGESRWFANPLDLSIAETADLTIGVNAPGTLSVRNQFTAEPDPGVVAPAEVNGLLKVGESNHGTVSVDTQGQLESERAELGVAPGSFGEVDVNGRRSRLSIQFGMSVGLQGTGHMTVQDAGLVEASGVVFGRDQGGFGTLDLRDSQTRFEIANTWTVARDGYAEADLRTGSTLNALAVLIGENAGSVGTVFARNTGTRMAANSIIVGGSGVGRLEVLDNAFVNANSLTIGPLGTVRIQGGNLQSTSFTNNGTIHGNGNVFMGGTNNGVIFADGSNTLRFTSTSITNTGTIDTRDSGTLVFSAALQNDGQIVGAGGTQTYLDGLTNAGSLVLTADTALFGDVNNAGAIIAANDSFSTMHGEVVSSGTISIAEGSEVLFLGGLDLSGNSSVLSLDGIGGGATIPVHAVGPVVLEGSLDVTLDELITPLLGDTFALATASGGFIGQFDEISLPSLPDGLFWNLDAAGATLQLAVTDAISGDYDDDTDVDGRDFLTWQRGESPIPVSAVDLSKWQSNYGASTSPQVAPTSSVPEPGTIWLLTIPGLAFANQKDRNCWLSHFRH